MKRMIIALTALAAACSQAPAEPNVRIDDVWARSVAPGQSMGAAYMTIANDGDGPDRLTSIKISVAASTEIHQTKTENGVSSMSAVGPLDIPAHGKVELKPGGTHAMMMGLNVPLQPGDRFFVDLNFEKSGKRTVSGKIVAAGER